MGVTFLWGSPFCGDDVPMGGDVPVGVTMAWLNPCFANKGAVEEWQEDLTIWALSSEVYCIAA